MLDVYQLKPSYLIVEVLLTELAILHGIKKNVFILVIKRRMKIKAFLKVL